MHTKIINQLIAMTKDVDHNVKIAALLALGEGGPTTTQVEEVILEFATHQHPPLRAAAAEALGRLFRRR